MTEHAEILLAARHLGHDEVSWHSSGRRQQTRGSVMLHTTRGLVELVKKVPAPGTRGSMRSRVKRRIGVLSTMLAILVALPFSGAPMTTSAQAQNVHNWKSDGDHVRHVVISVYKSKTFHLDQPFSTAVVGSPEIVDALPVSDRSLY